MPHHTVECKVICEKSSTLDRVNMVHVNHFY